MSPTDHEGRENGIDEGSQKGWKVRCQQLRRLSYGGEPVIRAASGKRTASQVATANRLGNCRLL